MHILWQKKTQISNYYKTHKTLCHLLYYKTGMPPAHKLKFETWFPDGSTILGSCGITEKWAQLEEADHCSRALVLSC